MILNYNREVTPMKKKNTDGHAQLAEFQAVVADHTARMEDRRSQVDGRIRDLEAELYSLRELQSRLTAAA